MFLEGFLMPAVLPFINAELWLLNDSVKGLHNGRHEFLQEQSFGSKTGR